MFERFNGQARQVVDRAREEARNLNQDHVDTGHILLGLVHESVDGVAVRVLESLGIGLEAVRRRAEEAVGRGDQVPPERIPLTPQAKKVLEFSLQEALRLNHNYIGAEHILLGLIREGDGAAAQVLSGLGANLDEARHQVLRLVDEYYWPKHGHQAG
jgi:ATP-dependent Clp protease ATP-binding subunit ClpC